MVVPEGTEEMVAAAAVDHGRADHAFYCAGGQHCACSLYLFAFLIIVHAEKLSGQGNYAGDHCGAARALCGLTEARSSLLCVRDGDYRCVELLSEREDPLGLEQAVVAAGGGEQPGVAWARVFPGADADGGDPASWEKGPAAAIRPECDE